MRTTYQVTTIRDGRQDQGEILDILRNIQAGRCKNDLKVLNYYNEVPISYPLKLDKIEADSIECTVHQAQAVAFSLQKQTLLTSASFPQGLGVHCFVEYINVKNSFAVLGRFAFAAIHAARRGAVRVTAGGHLPAVFRTDDHQLNGCVIDISISGIALCCDYPEPIGMVDNGVLHLMLQGNTLAVPAKRVASFIKDGERIVTFTINPDKVADNLIAQYIYTRQVDVIRTLKEQIL